MNILIDYLGKILSERDFKIFYEYLQDNLTPLSEEELSSLMNDSRKNNTTKEFIVNWFILLSDNTLFTKEKYSSMKEYIKKYFPSTTREADNTFASKALKSLLPPKLETE